MFWAMADQAIMSGARFLTVVLLGRYGSDTQLGLYSLGFGVLVLFVGIHEAFVTTPYTVFLPRKEVEDHASYQGFALRSTIQLSAILSFILLFAAVLGRFLPSIPGLMTVLVCVALTLPLVLMREFARRLQFAHGRTKMACVLDSIVALVQLVGLLLLMLMIPLTATSAIIASGVACLVSSIIWWLTERNGITHDRDNQRDDYVEHAKLGRWIFGENLVSAVHMYFGHWFLTLTQDSTQATGVFAACLSVIMLINPFLLAVTSLMTPRVAQAYDSRSPWPVAIATWKYTFFVTVIMSLFAVMMYLFGGQIAEVLFGDLVQGRTLEIQLLGLMMIAQGINYTLSVGLRVLNRPEWTLMTAVLGALATALTAFFVVQPTLTGVVVSLVVGFYAIALARMIAFGKLMLRLGERPAPLSSSPLLDTQE
jgi:O-antigen/teichoic acid export membrane protein